MSVTITSLGKYEYVIFNLKKPLNSGFSYSVSTVSPPFVEESGATITIAGNKFRKIRFTNVTWTCLISEAFSLPKPAIKGLARTEQFEGTVSYTVGYRNSSAYIKTYAYNAGSIRKVVMMFRK
jgi:hypothetical protein